MCEGGMTLHFPGEPQGVKLTFSKSQSKSGVELGLHWFYMLPVV